jgi:hypothetical protein
MRRVCLVLTLRLCILCESQNKQRLLSYTLIALIDWFCTVRSESHCTLRLQYVDLVKRVQVCNDPREHHFQHFYKCTATFRMQIYRKCLRIKLNGFRPVSTLVDITSIIFYKYTATFRTHCITEMERVYSAVRAESLYEIYTFSSLWD